MANLKKSLLSAYQAVASLATLGTYWLLRQPQPRYKGKLSLKGLSAPVEILRDRWGVPHIYAKTTADVLFAQGFVHAQERAWQMDFNRRLVAGRLSEILGPVAVPLDRWMRTLTMRRVAESEVALLDAETRSLLEAYAAGVNACLAREPLPLECRLLNFQPEPWIVADSLAWVKMMAWNLSVNWETEILRARLIAKLGVKNMMDNIFASIASGVITADIEDKVILCNRAAENILGQTIPQILGRKIDEVLPSIANDLIQQVTAVRATDTPIADFEISHNLPQRGPVDWRFNLSPLKDADQTTQGIAIVLDDLTERKRLEAQRKLFERMVSPAVIQQIDPNGLALGGKRTDITVLFADIRGFTSFSETLSPEQLVSVLNRYLAAGAECVLDEEGTIDKFLGDAVMAWFNAPIPQPDHTLRAVRAALKLRDRIAELHAILPPEAHLAFGVGIHCGDAVLGLIGTEKRLEYTAIGDSVNTTKRLQENAGKNQIVISQNAYERVKDQINVLQMEPMTVKGKRESIPVYEVLGLK